LEALQRKQKSSHGPLINKKLFDSHEILIQWVTEVPILSFLAHTDRIERPAGGGARSQASASAPRCAQKI
jgi:hypothetical protein